MDPEQQQKLYLALAGLEDQAGRLVSLMDFAGGETLDLDLVGQQLHNLAQRITNVMQFVTTLAADADA